MLVKKLEKLTIHADFGNYLRLKSQPCFARMLTTMRKL